MEAKSKNIYNVKSHTTHWNDIATVFYFVTLHTKNKHAYFGPTQIGDAAHRFWTELPTDFPFIELDAFSIESNQVRGILFLNRPKYESWRTNFFKPQSENLASIIRNYKDAVKRYAMANRIEFEWASGYTGHIIQSEIELKTIRQHVNKKKS